jgi:hypothetical protein
MIVGIKVISGLREEIPFTLVCFSTRIKIIDGKYILREMLHIINHNIVGQVDLVQFLS